MTGFLIVSIVLAVLVTGLGISVIGEDPVQREAGHIAIGSVLLGLMVAPAAYAGTVSDDLAVRLVAAWIVGGVTYAIAMGIYRIGKWTKKVTPGWGLVGTLVNLSYVAGLVFLLVTV